MEIRGVKKEKELEYPKLKEINKKKLKECIPSSWLKIGVTAIIFDLMMKSKVFAAEFGMVEVSGGIVAYSTEGMLAKNIEIGCIIVACASIIALIISLVYFISKKIKLKKANQKYLIKKKIIKTVVIVTILLGLSLFIGKNALDIIYWSEEIFAKLYSEPDIYIPKN